METCSKEHKKTTMEQLKILMIQKQKQITYEYNNQNK